MDVLTYTLRDTGADLVVELWTEQGKQPNHARLLVDGEEVDRGQSDEIGDLRLAKDSAHHTKVSWWWRGRVTGVALVESGVAAERHRRVPYAPPPDTRAARLHAWGERHPHLRAGRHVLIWAAGAAAVIFGLGAIVRALVEQMLPRVSFDWLPELPSLPSIDWPDWLRYLDPGRYLGPVLAWIREQIGWLADLLLGWVPDGPWLSLLAGLVVAVAVAVQEVRRQRRRTISQRPDPDQEDSR